MRVSLGALLLKVWFLSVVVGFSELDQGHFLTAIIIIHLLGLAPAGYLAAPDNGA
jgi:hypothetical protein